MLPRFGTALATATVLLALSALVVPGCGQQPEGARCEPDNANRDCVTGLVCTDSKSLRNGADGVARCCPESGSTVAACRPGTNSGSATGGSGNGTGGSSGGAGGEGGSLGVGGAISGDGEEGDICDYTSECRLGLVCGPRGFCQPECRNDLDCSDGKSCSAAGRCVEP